MKIQIEETADKYRLSVDFGVGAADNKEKRKAYTTIAVNGIKVK